MTSQMHSLQDDGAGESQEVTAQLEDKGTTQCASEGLCQGQHEGAIIL